MSKYHQMFSFDNSLVMGWVPENPTRPEGFLLTRTQNFFYKLKKPENPRFYILENPKKDLETRLEPNPNFFQNLTRTRHLATRPITVTVCRQNSWLLRNTIINIIFYKDK